MAAQILGNHSGLPLLISKLIDQGNWIAQGEVFVLNRVQALIA